MQLPIHKVPKIAVQNTEKSDHKQDLKIILSNWSFLFNGKKLWESRNLPIQFVVKMKTHLQIAPFMFFLSHIHKKRPRGVYNEAKNLKISWFYAGEMMRELWASKASKIPKRELVGWGLIWKTRLETFILNMRYAILSLVEFCYLLSLLVC